MKEKLKKILLSIQLFSRLVIRLPLYNYQIEPANAVIDSCLHRRGLEFLWIFPRQSGKDEAIAQMEVFLLVLFHRLEAALVHVYPVAGQIATGLQRLENRLNNTWFANRWWTKSKPTRRGIGQAMVAFFSGHPQAKSEGATANLLLIINEIQDQTEAIIDRRFNPMRAASNATRLNVGTVRTTSDYLWRKKQELEKLQLTDGYPRIFIVSAQHVSQENPQYKNFVAQQIRSKGRQHPIIKTEYFNEPVDVASGLFPARRIALMRGTHPRLRNPQESEIYLATLDVGGQDEAATHIFAELNNPGRDYTIATISRAHHGQLGPTYQVVDVFADQGTRHFQSFPGKPSLFDQLIAYLKHWRVIICVSDFTGIGQGLTDALTKSLPGVYIFPFDFSQSYNKARLGNDFLALIETGRFQYFIDEPIEGSDEWRFFSQAEHCSYELAEGLPIERGLRWGVRPGATIVLSSTGESIPVHDDYLLSAALLAEADNLYRAGKWFLSTGESAVIPDPDIQRKRGETWA